MSYNSKHNVVRHTISFDKKMNEKIQKIRINRMAKNPDKNVTFTEVVMEILEQGLRGGY